MVTLPIWIRYMESILKDKPVEEFAAPEAPEQLTLSERPEINAAATKKLFVEEIPGSPVTKKP